MKARFQIVILPLVGMVLWLLSVACYVSSEISSTTSIGAPASLPSITDTTLSTISNVVDRVVVCGTDSEHGLNLRAEAGTGAQVIGLLTNGETLDVVESTIVTDGGLWLKVKLEDGSTGWVNARYLCQMP